jgi:hypothetical protein
MRAFVVALAIALISVPAHAQGFSKGPGHKKQSTSQLTEAQKKERAEAEKAYKKAINSLPDKPYDPWQNVRP